MTSFFNKDFLQGTFKDRGFMRRMWSISLPIMLQQLISTSLYMVSTMMIGGLGDVPLAGVGAANQLAFLLDIMLLGIISGGGIYMSQYFGKKDEGGFKSTLGLTLMLCLGSSVLFVIVAKLFGADIVGLYSEKQDVIAAGTRYLSIACFGYIPKGVVYAYGIANKSAGNPKLPLISGAIAIGVGVVLNWCMIYGKLGFPQMGIDGAAIATLISSFVDMALLIALSYRKASPVRASLRALLRQNKAIVKGFLRVSFPAFLNEALYALCALAINWVYGKMGTDAFAALMIVNTVEKLTIVAFMGIGTSAAVIIGNVLGEGDTERAHLYGKRYMLLGLLTGLAVGLLCCLGLPNIVYLYANTSPAVRSLAYWTIVALGFIMPVYAINYTVICGVLRSGGDTRAAAIIDLAPQWLLALPLVAITGLWLKLPLYWVYVSIFPSAIARMFLAIRRASGDRWARKLV